MSEGNEGVRYIIIRTTRDTGEVRFYAGFDETERGIKMNKWTPNRVEAVSINEEERNLKMRGLTAVFDKEFKYTDESA